MAGRRTGPKTSPVQRAHDADCKSQKAIAKANEESAKAIKVRDKALDKFMGHAEALGNKLLQTQSPGKRVITDGLAVFGSVSSFEVMNLGIRALAEWSKETEGEKGWIYKRVAYLQSMPGVLGAIFYLFDYLNQSAQHEASAKAIAATPEGKEPPMPHVTSDLSLGFAKWSAMLVNLGLGNLARAIRYSVSEDIDEQRIKSEVIGQQDDRIKALEAEKAAAIAEARKEAEGLRAELQRARAGQR